MASEVSKRKVLRTLSNNYICRTIPLLHTIILFVEMAIVSRIVYKFNNYYADRPILTMMITNAILSGIADTVAQSISAIRLRRSSGGTSNQIPLAIEIHELDQKNSPTLQQISPDVKSQLPSFDFERLSRFMAYGCMMAPIQFKWFKFLSKSFPLTKQNGLESAFKMMALDQLIFAPAGIATFFTVMTIAEGGGRRAVSTKLRDMYLPTLKANFIVWPLVQMINFRLMPLQFQLPFVSTVSIAWTVYLSLSNASEDAEVRSTHQSPNFRLQ